MVPERALQNEKKRKKDTKIRRKKFLTERRKKKLRVPGKKTRVKKARILSRFSL
jgi:hypothetical protein